MPRNASFNELPPPEDFVITELLRCAIDLEVHATDLAGVIQCFALVESPVAGRNIAVAILERVLGEGLLQPGRFDSGWISESNEWALAEITRTWQSDAYPRLGESAVYFVLTEAGKQWLKRRDSLD